MLNNVLLIVIVTPLIGAFFMVTNSFSEYHAKQFGFFVSLFVFLASLILWVFFDNSSTTFQYIKSFVFFKFINIKMLFGVDGISLFFILLTTFLVVLCVLFSWDTSHKKVFKTSTYIATMLVIESFIVIVFSTLDLVVFYIFFEAVLLPMFLIMGVWGSRDRKTRASFILFIYTVFGSLFMLLGILFMFFETGSTNFLTLITYNFTLAQQKFLWIAFFLSFSVKVPIVPVHLWLPEAHVEAPTEGSVLLAGILLKLGTYGLIRFSITLFPLGTLFYKPLIYLLSLVAIIYTSMTALRQSDIKRVIAYASIAHMNITLVGLFSLNTIGIEGAIFQIISHGLVSGALFFCVGILYNRHHTKLIQYYSGLVQTIPLFVFFFLIFTIANIGLPLSSSFVGEFLILIGIFRVNIVVAFFSASSLIFGGCYALWLFNRLVYGNITSTFLNFSQDLSKKEFFVLSPLAFMVLFFGICPSIVLEVLHTSCLILLKNI